MADAVVVEGLHKRYGATVAVDDVSFRVPSGAIVGLLGPNGAGKTTTVECLQGLRRPDAGRVEVLGLDPVRDRRTLRRRVGSQLQSSALPDRLRVGEALRLFSSLVDTGPPWEQLLGEWGLTAQRDTAFGDLSGGQQQRLFVALALVSDPDLVVLDEMTTGLDPAARRVAWELVEAVRARGTTVLLVTHAMEEAARCDRLVVVVAGRDVASGTPGELVERAAGPTALTWRLDPGVDLGFLAAVPSVRSVDRDGAAVRVTGTGPVVVQVGHALVDHGFAPADLEVHRPSLEDAYLALTGQATAVTA